MEPLKILAKLDIISMRLFGSRAVGCAKEDSDYDYLVLVEEFPKLSFLKGLGLEQDAPTEEVYNTAVFRSWRFGDINIVFTEDLSHYEATTEACDFCKKHKIYDKSDRIAVHEMFRAKGVTSRSWIPSRTWKVKE